jgi:ABC-2 type transport system ATP-binding protein
MWYAECPKKRKSLDRLWNFFYGLPSSRCEGTCQEGQIGQKISLLQEVIQVESLTKRYGKIYAIDRVSFSVQAGEVIGFLGPNGAGKSTTLKILAGLLEADAGRVAILGKSVAENPHVASIHMGFMLANNPLPKKLRVGEYLRFRACMKGISSEEVYRHVEKIMRYCDLYYKARHRLIGSLSKGFRQRVGVAEALLGMPKVVILDEPTIGLDPHQVLLFRQLIEIFRGRYTFIISSHILSEIEAICDRILILHQGCLVADGHVTHLRKTFIKEATLIAHWQGDMSQLNRFERQYPKWKYRLLETDLLANTHILAIDFADDIEEKCAVWNAIFAHTSWKILKIEDKKPTLEDVFLAATRRYWDSTLSKI